MSRKRALEKEVARGKIGLKEIGTDIKDSSRDPGLEYVSKP
jgi:hypothetical protein